MPRTSWSELSTGQRRAIIAGAAIEGTFKTVALVDLARRPAERVRGPKALWAVLITAVNGFGIAPVAYFVLGRRR